MVDTVTAGIVAVIAGPVITVLAAWVHSRAGVRREEVRGQSLVALAGALRRGGLLEERRNDGSGVRVSVPPAPGCHDREGTRG